MMKKPPIKSTIARCKEIKQQEADALKEYEWLSELAMKHQTSAMDKDRQAALAKGHALRKEREKLARTLPSRYILKYVI